MKYFLTEEDYFEVESDEIIDEERRGYCGHPSTEEEDNNVLLYD